MSKVWVGMVKRNVWIGITDSICVCVCVRTVLGKLRTLVATTSYWETSNYTRMKNKKRLLLKPFGYKVITIFITHS